MSATGSYTQNFNSLSSTTAATPTWTDNSTIANWYAQRDGSGSTYIVGTGSSATGGFYSFGSTSASDRALGSVGSGTPGNMAWGVLLRNTSGYTITDIKIAYTGEQWRVANATAQTATFWYKTSSSSITNLNPGTSNTGWTSISALDFTSVQNSSTAAALDGNNSSNRTAFSATSIPSLSLVNNDYIMLRWSDIDHTGSDNGLSIDDVTISWTVSSTPPNVVVTAQDPNTPTAVDWGKGTTGNIFYWAAISPTAADASLSSVSADMTGSYVAADIQANGLKLYYSADATFTPGTAPDALLGSQSSAKVGATETITWLSLL